VTVADADGTNLVALTKPLEVTSWAWSPDGSQLAVAVKSATSFMLVNLDGSPTTDVDLGMSAEFLQWRPGGRELVFRGVTGGPGGPTYGLYVVRVDGSDLRPIKSPTDSGEHWQNPALSPDGERLIYTTWDPGGGNLYAVAIDSGEVQQLVFDAGPDSDYYAQWSPDGSRVVFNRGRAQETYRLAVGPATGGQAVDIGPVLAWDAAADAVFSPDGSKVIARYGDGSTWLFDVTSGQGEQVLSASALFVANWQRLTP
jgi:Tol biopolymer transport system component